MTQCVCCIGKLFGGINAFSTTPAKLRLSISWVIPCTSVREKWFSSETTQEFIEGFVLTTIIFHFSEQSLVTFVNTRISKRIRWLDVVRRQAITWIKIGQCAWQRYLWLNSQIRRRFKAQQYAEETIFYAFSGSICFIGSMYAHEDITASWHGNTFCITDLLWRESTRHHWDPLTKGQFCCVNLNKRLNKELGCRWFKKPCRACDVTVINYCY